MTTTLVHRVEHRRDGVLYTISVESSEGLMHGNWICRECATGGSSRNACRTIGDAVLSAQDEIDMHHKEHHLVLK